MAATLLVLAAPGFASAWTNPCESHANSDLPFCDMSLSLDKRATDLVGRISDYEKLGMLVNTAEGAPSLKIPAYEWWSEALHGVGDSPGVHFGDPVPAATSFPQVQTTSMSWNATLFGLIGTTIGTEARAFANLGHAGFTFWTPNINIFRDPRWGRGQETPGEDPTLNGVYATEFVTHFQQGPEDKNHLRASACCKHFEEYSLEDAEGVDRFHFDAIVSQQDMQDSYRPAFEACVSMGHASGLMCSYNSINGVPSCADYDHLTNLVRGTWDFDGYITSDCGAVENVYDTHNYTQTVEEALNVTFAAGMDLDCGSFASRKHLNSSLAKGVLKWETVDRALVNLVKVQMRLGLFDDEKTQPYAQLGVDVVNTRAHQQLALEAARQGITLLKNNGSNLPFKGGSGIKIAAIGPHGNATLVMQGNYQGVAPYLISPLQALEAYGDVSYNPGCSDSVPCKDDSGFSDAVDAVDNADVVVMFFGIDQTVEAESRDRSNISLPGRQQQLIEIVAKTATNQGKPCVLVLMAGGSLDVAFARDSGDVPSILWTGYPGQSGGQAIAEVLFGDVNPSGKLTQTIYPQSFANEVSMKDMRMRPNGTFPGRGYRFYTGDVVYPFAHGLSYTSFAYSWASQPTKALELKAVEDRLKMAKFASASPEVLSLEVDLQNKGPMDGAEVVIAMISPPNAGYFGAPKQMVAAFEKVFVKAGGSQRVRLSVSAHDLALATEDGEWNVVPGEWTMKVAGLAATTFIM